MSLPQRATTLWIALLCACAALAGPCLARAPLLISTSDMPPLAIEAAPGAPGAMHEVVSELMRKSKLPAQIAFVPWQRALFLTTARPHSAIFPVTRTPEREAQFRWLLQLYQGSFVFITLKTSAVPLNDSAPDKQQRIGVLRGSVMTKMLRDKGYRVIVEASTVDEAVRLLRRGIVDAVAGERAIYRSTLKGLGEHAYRSSEPVAINGMWLAGSLDLGQADAALLQKTFKEMLDDGSYAHILKQYDMSPGS